MSLGFAVLERRAALSGQVAPLFVCLLLVLVAFVGLAVDFAGAYREKTMQDQSLEIAKDAVFSEGENIKFNDRPDQVAFESVEDALVANGFDGRAECWFYEVEKGYRSSGGVELADGRRVSGVCLALSGSYKPLFLSVVGAGDMPISGDSTWTMDFYSTSQTVWRPGSAAIGKKAVWSFDDGATSGAQVSSISLGDAGFPQDMKKAIDAAVEDM